NIDSIGFLYSTDEGNTWTKVTQIPNQIGDKHVKAFAFASKDTVIASSGTSGASDLYRTTDDGVTWQNIGHYEPAPAQLLIHPDGSYLLRQLGETGGVFRSTDEGKTFKKIFPTEPGYKDFFSMMVDSKGTIIVTTDLGVYRSTEGDVNISTWYSISSGLTAYDSPNNFIKVAGIVENPQSHIYFAATRGLGVYRSD